MSELFGWDLIYKLSENDLNKKEDTLTLFVHYVLIKGGYKCVGLGEDKVFTGNEVSGETLPPEWNKDGTYSIRYFLNNTLYILKGIPVETNIVYNLLNVTDMKVTNVAFNIDNTIGQVKGELSSLIPNHEEVLKKIQKDLVKAMGNGNTKEATTQVTQPAKSKEKAKEGKHSIPLAYVSPTGSPRPFVPHVRESFRVGADDLDPWSGIGGGMGGGMLFHVPRPPMPDSFPGPSIPRVPGARFDPVLPPMGREPRSRRPPGSDFNPPGFEDFL